MFCRNCGNPMNDNERVCSRCGALRSDVQGAPRTCRVCGNPIQDGAAFCNKCGTGTAENTGYAPSYGAQNAPTAGGKSKVAAGLLGIFLGAYGVHNFYLGYKKKAVLQLALSLGSVVAAVVLFILGALLSIIYVGILLFIPAYALLFVPGGVGIWALIEGIMILCGKINVDGNGNPLID